MTRARLIGLVVLIITMGVLIFLVRACASKPAWQEAAAAKAQQARAEGQVKAATDATAITADVMTEAAAIDEQTRENEDAIRSSGGDAAVALRSLCLRRAYQHHPRCLALQRIGAGPDAR